MKKINLLLIMITMIGNGLFAQAPGDTIKVQSWIYSSNNRDTVVNFPTNQNIERVIMRYAMRCKDALVSSGTNRNLGCGEWDYSCNTYVHNPMMADSLPRTIDKYQITPSINDSVFSSIPTFEYRPKVQLTTTIDSIISESRTPVGQTYSTTSTTDAIDGSAENGKSIIHYSAAELSNAGITAGNIDGLYINAATTGSTIKDLRIGIKHSSTNPFSSLDTNATRGFQNVYYRDTYFNFGGRRVQFHSPFNWNGTSDILIELSYHGGDAALTLFEDSLGSAIASTNDYSLDLFPSNYVQANSYKVISGTNPRTVEAWIKTTSGGEISSWGTNTTGAKQSFRVVDNTGYIRLEINGGYIVGSTPVNDGEWHHVAYTFSGATISNVALYVDGNLETVSSINNISMNTGSSLDLEISRGFHNRYFNGEIDQLRIWSAALIGSTLKDWIYRKAEAPHPYMSFLELAYPITSDSSFVEDVSGNNRDATFRSTNSFKQLSQLELFKEFRSIGRPFMEFYQGNYQLTTINDTVMDTIPQTPYIVEERTIVSRAGSTSTDSIGRQVSNYYPKNNQLFDLSGNPISSTLSTQLATLGQRTLNYYQRNPQKVEIMSFVTPYGINLDLGVDGKAWYFDVSDFMPVLTGNRRMTMERGGQWQEEMDIEFYFIVGTPPADVKSMQEIWKVDQRPYSTINNNTYFAPRTIQLDTSARRFKVRSAITGHGQQGEFIPRTHTIYVNTTNQIPRQVWKECAENPVYPQGGTWIYDRAGWCPGMATDVAEYDITNWVNAASSVNLDYNVSGASGTSNYIVSTQLVQYGLPNFANDARIENVLRPNNQTEFGRKNPSCYNPAIIIRNTGSNNLTAASIDLSINGGTPFSFNWSGNLAFMDQATITVPVPATFWSNANLSSNTFTARITGVNNGTDQYVHNNEYNSRFVMPDTLPSPFRIIIKTNLQAFQNSISITNSASQVVFTRTNLPNNQTTGNVITIPAGCYQLRLNDTGDDGLSFFANPSAGSGYFRLEDSNFGVLKNFNPDFGDRIEYYFTIAQGSTSLEEASKYDLRIYPNPTDDQVSISYSGKSYSWTLRNSMGQLVKSRSNQMHFQMEVIELDDLAKGIYYLSIDAEDERLLRKLIKQ